MKIAVLALQGAFIEHEKRLADLGVTTVELRKKQDLLSSFDGLILPGGESTVQGKLLRELDMYTPLRDQIVAGLPVFGTCAGLILLADRLENDDKRHLATMHISVMRNGYGRQLGSFYTEAECRGIGRIPMTFIRAPYISSVGEQVEVLSEVNGRIVAAREGHQLVTAFHPELNADTRMHEYFLSLVSAG